MVETKPPESFGDSGKTAVCACTDKNAQKICRKPRYWLWIVVFFAVYVVSVVPVGLFLYTIKTEAGIDLFRYGGLHAYGECIDKSFALKRLQISH